jgi:hypothetical protein
MGRVSSCLVYFSPVSVGIKPVVTDHNGFGLIKPSGGSKGVCPFSRRSGRKPWTRRGGRERSERWKGEVSSPSKETWPLSGM